MSAVMMRARRLSEVTDKDILEPLIADLNDLWLLFGALLVFFMQAGFALLEAGSVRPKNTKNILLKNVMDACAGALLWWSIGYPFAYGEDGKAPNHFIGGNNFFMMDSDISNARGFFAGWMFQWAFAATAATIVSGAVAERCKFVAYIIYSSVMTAFIYPVAVHWGWSAEGWLSAFNTLKFSNGKLFIAGNGLIDFAGSGIVHMTGGSCALMAAYFMGPRLGRFKDGKVVSMQGASSVLITLGTFILWFGWYGFNSVSTLALVGGMGVATKVAVTTTLAAAAGGTATLLVDNFMSNVFDVAPALNGILAGLVGITAGASVVEPYAAVIIGLVAGVVYYFCSVTLKYMQIDDPVDASPIHLGCGIWGVLAVGLFATERNTCASGYSMCDQHYGLFYGGGGEQLAMQILGVVMLLTWGLSTSGIMFFALQRFNLLRVDSQDEERGLDLSHHGGHAWNMKVSPNEV